MPIIKSGDSTVTHINVFTVAPERQQELVDSLKETVNEAKQVGGWVSAAIHRSLDGTKVVNYVQFESAGAAHAVTQHLLSHDLIQRNTSIASVAPGQYEVVYTLDQSSPQGRASS